MPWGETTPMGRKTQFLFGDCRARHCWPDRRQVDKALPPSGSEGFKGCSRNHTAVRMRVEDFHRSAQAES